MSCFREVFAAENQKKNGSYLNVGIENLRKKNNNPKVYHYRIVDVKVTCRAEC